MAQMLQLPDNETERLQSVRSLISVNAVPTPELRALAELAQAFFGTPFAAVNILDEDWLRVACHVGISVSDFPRELSICSRVVYANEMVVIPNLAQHPQLRDLPYVSGEPHFMSYAGAPVSLERDLAVGTFCILDTKPRDMSEDEIRQLRHFADIAGALLRLQRSGANAGTAAKA